MLASLPGLMQMMQMSESFIAADHQSSWMLPACGSVVYLSIIFFLKNIASLPVYQLKEVAVIHNLILISLSVVMFFGGVSSLYDRYAHEGFDGVFCSQRTQSKVLDGPAGFWIMIFFYSKFYELGDTVLMCLKHKWANVSFLHVYHHVVMLWLTWSWLRYGWFEGSLWCVIVNSLIHTFMYTHYLLAVLKYTAWWKKYLTTAQLVQFATGTAYVIVYMYNDVSRATAVEGGCGSSERRYTALAASTVNITFIMLFALFFRATYGKSTGAKQA